MADIDRTIETLKRLPAESRELVASLVEQLAKGAGMDTAPAEYRLPADSVPLWVARLRSERRSERTITMYKYWAEKFLGSFPKPTRLDVQGHLAKRLEQGKSAAAVENQRKALTSLFRFLTEEGLWPENPLEGLRHIKVQYSQKQPPSVEDVERVLAVGCARQRDSDKMRMAVVLLMTTGLRLTEGLSLRKDGVDAGAMELRVTGKGDKPRVVPLLKVTAEMLAAYIEKYPGGSPFVFPGRTRTGYAEIYNIQKTLKRACLRAGVRPFTPHGLRHFYATEMLRGGAKLEVVSRILGHASVGITGDIYRFVKSEEMHQEAERFAPLNGAKMLPEG
jgi:integrase/recombinase XerD